MLLIWAWMRPHDCIQAMHLCEQTAQVVMLCPSQDVVTSGGTWGPPPLTSDLISITRSRCCLISPLHFFSNLQSVGRHFKTTQTSCSLSQFPPRRSTQWWSLPDPIFTRSGWLPRSSIPSPFVSLLGHFTVRRVFLIPTNLPIYPSVISRNALSTITLVFNLVRLGQWESLQAGTYVLVTGPHSLSISVPGSSNKTLQAHCTYLPWSCSF